MFRGQRLLFFPVREGDGYGGHGEGHHVKEEAKHYRCPAGTTPQCSRSIPAKRNTSVSANGVCVRSMKLFFVYKEDFSCCEADGRRFWPR